jgi:hypothetical protein
VMAEAFGFVFNTLIKFKRMLIFSVDKLK